MLNKGCYRILIILVFVYKGENDSNTLRVDVYFSENLPFRKYPDTCVDGPDFEVAN